MKFDVNRASRRRNEDCPTEGAILRTWVNKMGNECQQWELEIATVEDLMALIGREGDVIVGAPFGITDEDLPRLTIYDDYVE